MNTLEKINKASSLFLVPLSPEETYKIIVEEALKFVDAQKGSIFLAEDGKLVRVYASDTQLYKTNIRSNGFTYTAFKTRKPSVVSIKNIQKYHPHIKEMGIKSTIYIPLFYKKKAFGVISVDSTKDRRINSEELETLAIFGVMATFAIKKTQLYSETQQALDVRNMFISIAAHELRTPLTTISGYVQLLQQKLQKDSREAGWVQEMSQQSFRLTKIINNLLDVSKIKSDKTNYIWEECDIQAIVYQAVNRLRISYPKREVIVSDNEKKYSVVGDTEKLLHVFIHILENAAKYSPVTSKIEIKVSSQSNMILVTITDYGIGMTEEELKKIFQGFYKGVDNFEQGMGMGLLISDYIVKKHHGTIQIKSKKGKGTKVIIKLPYIKL